MCCRLLVAAMTVVLVITEMEAGEVEIPHHFTESMLCEVLAKSFIARFSWKRGPILL